MLHDRRQVVRDVTELGADEYERYVKVDAYFEQRDVAPSPRAAGVLGTGIALVHALRREAAPAPPRVSGGALQSGLAVAQFVQREAAPAPPRVSGGALQSGLAVAQFVQREALAVPPRVIPRRLHARPRVTARRAHARARAPRVRRARIASHTRSPGRGACDDEPAPLDRRLAAARAAGMVHVSALVAAELARLGESERAAA